jgi:hypothetical protein
VKVDVVKNVPASNDESVVLEVKLDGQVVGELQLWVKQYGPSALFPQVWQELRISLQQPDRRRNNDRLHPFDMVAYIDNGKKR